MTPEQIADRDSVWERIAKEHPEFTRAMDISENYHTVREIVLGGAIPWAGANERFKPSTGAKVMDIGANVGIYSAFCAANGADVTAYEPHPHAFAQLMAMIKNTGLPIKAINKAVFTFTGLCPFAYHVNPDPMCTWYNGGVNFKDGVEVPCLSFRRAIGDTSWDCVKMDIEGAEFDLLLNASLETLRKIKFMYLELHPWINESIYRETLARLESVYKFDGAYWNSDIGRWEAVYLTL